MGVKTKEEVFAIMGKYYGNAYWREAIKYSYSEEQLLYVSEILDKINALGYNFSNLQRLTDHEDIRFVPIILNYIRQRKWWVSSLLDAFINYKINMHIFYQINMYKFKFTLLRRGRNFAVDKISL